MFITAPPVSAKVVAIFLFVPAFLSRNSALVTVKFTTSSPTIPLIAPPSIVAVVVASYTLSFAVAPVIVNSFLVITKSLDTKVTS